MPTSRRSGFNVIELAVVTVVVVLLVLVLMPAFMNASSCAVGTAVGTRGRDIYVAISGANSERAAVGLPPVWPSDSGSLTCASGDMEECFNFTNSTDYFAYLNDAAHLGTERWNPRIAGFDYSKLSGGGVPACRDNQLTADYNMWTIAKNVRDDLPDIIPVLVTRNVDASSLAAHVTERDGDKSLRFDQAWETPFGSRLVCLIRKGGGIFKAREKHLAYRIVYRGGTSLGETRLETFNTAVDECGQLSARPLKYLTPTHEVVPGGLTSQTGADYTRVRRVDIPLSRELRALKRLGLPVSLGVGFLYLVMAVVYGAVRLFRHKRPLFPGLLIPIGMFHYIAVTLYAVFLAGYTDQYGFPPYWTHLLLAVVVQGLGVAFVVGRAGSDCTVRTLSVKWLVAAPLLVYGFVLSIMVIMALLVEMGVMLSALGVLAFLVIVATMIKSNIGRGRCSADDHEPQDEQPGGAS